MYKQDYYAEDEQANDHNVRTIMIHFGFDFSLLGSVYLYELIEETLYGNNYYNCYAIPTMVHLAEKHNIKVKTLNRNIRWSIDKAFKSGLLKCIPCFKNFNTPPTKQVLAWLCNFFYLSAFDIKLC